MRLVYLEELRGTPFFSIIIGDGLQFDILARQILSGDWSGSDVFYQGQLYPYFLALAYKILGTDAIAVRLLQAVLGAASCVLLAMAGRSFFDARSGLIAGAMVAIYPPAIFFDGLIQKSSPDLFIMAVLLVAIGACVREPRAHWVLIAGIALGALSWNRENARVLVPVVAAWLALSYPHVPLKRRAIWLGVLAAGLAMVLVPVAIRNARVTGEFFMTTSQFGPNFYIGNRLGASGGYEPLVPGRGNPVFERQDAIRLAEEARGRPLSPGEVSDYWFERTLDDIRGAPGSWLGLMARKTWMTFAAVEPIDTESLEAYADSSRLLRVLGWSTFGIVLALAAAGAWLTIDRWRRLAVLYAMFAAMAASIVLFFVFARYRFPLVPIAMLFAGAGVSRLWELRAASRRAWAPAAAMAVALAVLLHIPVRTSADETYFNYGSEFLRLGRPSDAVPMLREAIRVAPDHPQARLSLALAYERTGQSQLATETLRDAIAANPESVEAHVGLAMALHQQGGLDEAERLYREGIRLSPQHGEARNNLGLVLQQRGQSNEAIEQFAAAAAAQPQNLAFVMNLGSALLEGGRTTAAIATFQRAVTVSSKPEDVLQAEYALAQAYLAERRVPEALEALERALAAARTAKAYDAAETIQEGIRTLRARRARR